MLPRLLQNHVLANLTFVVVLAVGFLSYASLPREQDPTINFNWIEITTRLTGASAEDVEKQVTDIIEEAVRKVPDVRFVSSNSREGTSAVLVRFEDIDEATFDKRINDLRREIQNKERELPRDAETPEIYEVTSANAFPSATLVVTGPADDENLRWQSELIREDLERVKGVDRILPIGLRGPELQVNFMPERLEGLGITPGDLADTVTRYFRDVSAGTIAVNRETWLIRLNGAVSDPEYLARLPVVTAKGEVSLGRLATVGRGREKADRLVRFDGQPAILMAVTKKPDTNLLQLVERISDYIETRNTLNTSTGVRLVLVDDQTQITRQALLLMEHNSLLGLLLVLIVTWAFLGTRIAFLTCIGIPFILAGTFWVLSMFDQTLNVTVLLGVVISLGMLVDDAVVVVEAIFYRLQRGMEVMAAVVAALNEVAAPVTAAVLTTIAAFLPLMLLPGILGKFMQVIPMVVTVALLISLLEAYWLLPVHVASAKISFVQPSRIHRIRVRALQTVRIKYTRMLIRVLRYPTIALSAVLLMFALAVGALAKGMIDFNFFASDPLRLFYVNLEMPPGTPLADTLAKTLEVEGKVRAHLQQPEVRAIVSYAGQKFNEAGQLYGDQHGQILVGLNPETTGARRVDDIIEGMRADVESTVGPRKLVFLRLAGGPPTEKPINIKVRGENIDELRAAVAKLRVILESNPAILDVSDDDSPGVMELTLTVNQDAAQRSGVDPMAIARAVNLLVDGEVVASMQDRGEELDVRIRAKPTALESLDELLRHTLPARERGRIPLSELVHQETRQGQGNIRHYNFRRTITVEADIDNSLTNTVAANEAIVRGWNEVSASFPGVTLDFSGELDDIEESIGAIQTLFLFGVGLIYLILGTQFRSYYQPFMVLVTVPMAFTGVVLGLLITGNPLSLYTLYGVVALAGIAVNSAIVLISAANDRLASGMSLLHATLYAARRRVVPILITSLTTIAGLFSLAAGLAGHSLIWGPVATAIVWGLGFSSILTLLVIPLLYRMFMARSHRVRPYASGHAPA